MPPLAETVTTAAETPPQFDCLGMRRSAASAWRQSGVLGRREPSARIGVIVHLRDHDVGAAAGVVERPAHDQRSPGIALNQEDHLAVAQQGCQRPRHCFLRIATGHDNDDIGAVNGRSQIARRPFDSGEAGLVALDINAAESPDVGKSRIIDIVQAQLEPGEAELSREVNPANSGADDRDRLYRAFARHVRLLRAAIPAARLIPAADAEQRRLT